VIHVDHALDIPGTVQDVPRVRAFVTQQALESPSYGEIRDDVELVRVRLEADDDRVRVEVSDAARALPRPRQPGPWDVGGRGLQLVAALSRRWGVEEIAGDGKTVWCEIAVHDR
jgi:hypothetical protein